eukprot:Opistho-2@91689
MGQTKLTNVRMRVLVSAALVCCLAGSSLAGTLEDEVWGAGSSFTATDKGSGTVNVVFSPISPTSPVVTTVSKYLVSVDDGVAVPLSPSTTTYDFKNLLGNATHVFNLQVEVLISGVVTIVDSPQSGIAVDVAPYGILWNSVPLAGKAIPNPAIFPTIATVTIDMNRFFRASTGAASLILNSPLKTLGYRCPGASSDTNLDITLSSWKVTCTTVTITCGSSANVTVKATGTVGATASATLSVSGLCHTSWSGKALTFTNRATNAFDISVPYPSAIGSGTLFVAHIYNWDGTTATFLTTSCNSIPSNPGDNTTLSVPDVGRTETLAAGKSYRVKFFALVAGMDSSSFCTGSTPTDPTGTMTANTQYLVATVNTTGENPKWTGSATTSVVRNADSRQLLVAWPKPSFVGSFVAYNVTVVVKDMKTSIVSAPSAVGTPITNVNTLSVLSTMQPSKNYTFTITATSTWDNVRYSSAVTAQEIIGNAYVWPAASDAIVFASTSSALEANRTADPSVAPSDYNVTVTVTGPGGFYYKSPILDIQSDKTYTFRALSADTYGNYTVTYTADGKPGVFNSSVVVLAGCGAPTLKAGQISIDGAGDDAANYYLAVKFTTPAILNANCAPGAVSYRLSFVPKSYTFDDKVNNFNLLSYNADVNIAQFATDGVIRPGSVYDVTLQAYNSGQKFATLLQIITMPYRAAVWLPNPSIPSIDYTNVPAGFKLEWYAPDYPNGPLDRFIAEWYNTENVGTVYSANVSVGVDTYPSNAAKFTYTVTGLRGTEVYVARVKAVSKFGGFISSPVTTPEITIDPTAPEFADGDVVVTPGRSNGDYIITVYLPLYNTTVVSYGNNYDKPTATVACPPNAQLRSPWDGTYICTGLDGFTSYDITVTVSTPGFSTPKKFTAKTLQGEVDWGASAVAIVTPIDSTSLQVVAAAPKKTNGNVVKLVTFVVANNVLALAPIVQKPSSSSSVGFPYKPVISGLKPYTMYSIIICAFTAADTSLDNIPVGATLTANANYNLRASQAPGSILYGRNLTHASAPVWGDSPLVTLTWTSTSSLTVRHASPQAANSDIKTITGKIYTDYTVTAQDTLYIGPISDGPTSSNNADTLVFTVGTAQFVPGQTLYLEITAIGSSDLSPTSIYSSSFHTDLTFEAPVYESDTITGQGITLRTDLTAAGTIVLSKVPLPKTTIFNVTDYIVKVYPNAKCSADSTNFAQFRSIPAASAGLPVRFNGLLPATQYCVTIDARYNADVVTVYYGVPSVTTLNGAPMFADGDVILTPGRNLKSFFVTVYMPLYNTTVVSYPGSKVDKPTAAVTCPVNSLMLASFPGTFVCTKLDAFTIYEITVNVSTAGLATQKNISVQTLRGEVDWGSSAIAGVVPIDSNTLQVSMAAPSKPNGNVVKIVTFALANGALAVAPIVQRNSSFGPSILFPLSFSIGGLRPSTMYSIIICAFTAADTSLDNIAVGATLTANANFTLRASQAPESILNGQNAVTKCGALVLNAGTIMVNGAGDDATNNYLSVKFTAPAILNANCAASYRLSFVPNSYTFDEKAGNFDVLAYRSDGNISQFVTNGVIRPGSVYNVTLQASNNESKMATLTQLITMPFRAAVWLPNPSIPSIDYTNVPAGFKLEWYAPDYPNGPLDRFIAEWYNTENVGTVYSANVSVGVDTYPSNAAKFTYTVTGLRGTEVYVARVKAVSKFGGFISSPVTTPEITIDPTAPEFADGDVVVTPGRSNGDYIITVYLPLYNTTVVSYGNNYDKPTAAVTCPPGSQMRTPWDGTYVCAGLDGFTSYDITVTVSTPGFSTPKKFTAKTLQGEVDWGASAVAIVTPIDSTSLQVVAAAPKKTNGNVVKLVTFVVANNVLALAPIVQKPSSGSSVGFPYKPMYSALI